MAMVIHDRKIFGSSVGGGTAHVFSAAIAAALNSMNSTPTAPFFAGGAFDRVAKTPTARDTIPAITSIVTLRQFRAFRDAYGMRNKSIMSPTVHNVAAIRQKSASRLTCSDSRSSGSEKALSLVLEPPVAVSGGRA